MKKIFLSKKKEETKKIGQKLAEIVLGNPRKKAAVVCLVGDLGAGKTQFAKGLAKGLGVKDKITSPTFLIIRKHQIYGAKAKHAGFRDFFHIDCYRIKNKKDLKELGIDEILKNSANVVVAEWASLVKNIFPADSIWVYLDHKDKNMRRIIYQRGWLRNSKKTKTKTAS